MPSNHFAVRGFACLLILSVTAVPAVGQVQWQQVPTPGVQPPERNVGTMDFIDSRGETFLYSGWHPSTNLTDLWSWDGSAWTLLDPSAAPGLRFAHAMTYDLVRDRLMVFGGARGFYINDTWELDCQTLVWTQMNPANAPAPRAGMSYAFDLARGVTVIFGGGDFGGSFDETWEWDGIDWTLRTFAVRPAARSNHAMAYDITRQRIVLFGGMGAAGVLSDTWEYDGTSWIQRNPTVSPSSRGVHAMVWDGYRERTVMYGGNSDPWQSSGLSLDETWEWDGDEWSLRTTLGQPDNTWQRCLTYDNASSQVLLFGGGVNRDELWAYDAINPATTVAFGSGCPGSLGTPTLFNSGPAPWLGETLTISLTPSPPTGALLVAGLSATAPVSLQALGMPGCNAYVTFDAAALGAAANGFVTWNLAVPNQASLLGFQLHQQAAVLDAQAPGGLAVSNAITLTVGGR